MGSEKKIYGRKKNIGTLVPLFSIWSEKTNNPQGTFEDGMYFLDWLHRTGQHAWQLLPLHETPIISGTMQRIASPYKSYGVGLDPRYLPEGYTSNQPSNQELRLFMKQHNCWVEDYALFCSLRDQFKTDNWTTWEEPIKRRDPDALNRCKKTLAPQIEEYIIQQWQLHAAYAELRRKADHFQILLIGDAPFYMPIRSPIVWSYQQLFHITSDGVMDRVSGIPERPRELYGRQLWGHPLYRWDEPALHPHILTIWKHRLQYLERLHDIVRLDHAVGFFHYGSLDPKNQVNDTILPGPGEDFFQQIVEYSKQIGLHLYAEEASIELKELRQALVKLHIPGIRVLRFALNTTIDAIQGDYADPKHYPIDTFAYTTIHDTEPLLGFLQRLNAEQKKRLATATKIQYTMDDREMAISLRQTIIDSPAEMVIIQIQDWLLTKDRINTPGTENEENDSNWQYRLQLPIENLPNYLF